MASPYFAAAIRTSLQENLYVARLLSTFDFGDDVNRPAVFVGEPAPFEVPAPLIVIVPQSGNNTPATKGRRGRIDEVTVKAWLPINASSLAISSASSLIWSALDRSSVEIEGFGKSQVDCSLGSEIKDVNDFPGVQFTASAELLEE